MRAFSPHPVAWSLIGLLLLISFGFDFANVQQGGSIDLRNRVTGTRLLLAHLDPYFYKWAEPEPPEYCDPLNNPHLPVSKTTATPAMLIFDLPVAVLPYRAGQFLWLFLQWALLIGTGWIWLRHLDPGWKRLPLAVFLTAFTFTAAWRLHAERGQSYVLLLFLFAAWLGLTLRPGRVPPFFTGLLAGFLVALRPPFLLLAPFLALHRRGQLPGAFVGLLLALALPMLWKGDSWLQYNSAMAVHSTNYREEFDPRPGPERFPAEIEGMSTDLLANYVAIPYADFSVYALLREFGLDQIPAWPPLLAVTAAFAVWLWQSRRETVERLLLGLAVWLFLADLCLPAYRDSYNDVLIINVVALGLLLSRRVPVGARLCFAALPVGWAIYIYAPMHDWMINLPSLFLTIGAIVLLFSPAALPEEAKERRRKRAGQSRR